MTVTELEARYYKRWNDWLQTPEANDRLVAAHKGGDPEAFKRLVRAAIAVDHPGWAKTIERANAKFSDCCALSVGAQ